MRGIANLIQSCNEVIELVLGEGYTQVDEMVLWRRCVVFPASGDVVPSVLDLEIIPALLDKRFSERGTGNDERK